MIKVSYHGSKEVGSKIMKILREAKNSYFNIKHWILIFYYLFLKQGFTKKNYLLRRKKNV